MKAQAICILFASIVAHSAARADAASVTFHPWTQRPVTAEEVNEMISGEPSGLPADSKVVDFYVSTSADILSNSHALAQTTGEFYRRPRGPLDPIALPPTIPNSWYRTIFRGSVAELGKPFPGDGTDLSTWGDTANVGPVTNFNFVRLTISPASAAWSVRGVLTLAGDVGPESFPFSFAVPEPNAMALLGPAIGIVVAWTRRRGNSG